MTNDEIPKHGKGTSRKGAPDTHKTAMPASAWIATAWIYDARRYSNPTAEPNPLVRPHYTLLTDQMLNPPVNGFFACRTLVISSSAIFKVFL